MNIAALVKRVRTEFLDDIMEPFFWGNANIIAALSNAERELCKRLFLISDSATAETCQIPVVAGVRSYAIDSRILRIDRMKYPDVITPLPRATEAYLDAINTGWEEWVGIPSCYILDTDSHTVTFDSLPLVACTVKMTVKRLPLLTLLEKATSAEPELKQIDDELIHGALKYLYLKPDAETFNVDMSKKWDNQFETDIKQMIQNRAAMNPQSAVCRPERF